MEPVSVAWLLSILVAAFGVLIWGVVQWVVGRLDDQRQDLAKLADRMRAIEVRCGLLHDSRDCFRGNIGGVE